MNSVTLTSIGPHTANISLPKIGTLIPNRIFVGGISSTTTEEDLRNFFIGFGPIKDVKVIYDRSGQSKGNYGFVTFEHQETAEMIIKHEAESLTFKDRKINIGYAVRKQIGSLILNGSNLRCSVTNGLSFIPINTTSNQSIYPSSGILPQHTVPDNLCGAGFAVKNGLGFAPPPNNLATTFLQPKPVHVASQVLSQLSPGTQMGTMVGGGSIIPPGSLLYTHAAIMLSGGTGSHTIEVISPQNALLLTNNLTQTQVPCCEPSTLTAVPVCCFHESNTMISSAAVSSLNPRNDSRLLYRTKYSSSNNPTSFQKMVPSKEATVNESPNMPSNSGIFTGIQPNDSSAQNQPQRFKTGMQNEYSANVCGQINSSRGTPGFCLNRLHPYATGENIFTNRNEDMRTMYLSQLLKGDCAQTENDTLSENGKVVGSSLVPPNIHQLKSEQQTETMNSSMYLPASQGESLSTDQVNAASYAAPLNAVYANKPNVESTWYNRIVLDSLEKSMDDTLWRNQDQTRNSAFFDSVSPPNGPIKSSQPGWFHENCLGQVVQEDHRQESEKRQSSKLLRHSEVTGAISVQAELGEGNICTSSEFFSPAKQGTISSVKSSVGGCPSGVNCGATNEASNCNSPVAFQTLSNPSIKGTQGTAENRFLVGRLAIDEEKFGCLTVSSNSSPMNEATPSGDSQRRSP